MWNPAFKNQSTHLPKFPKSFFPGAKRDGLRPRATYTEPIQRRMAAQRNAKRKGAAADVDSAGGLAGGAGSEGDGLVKISGFQQTGFQHEDGPNIQVKIK